MKFLGEIENIHDVVNKSYVESLIEGTATDIASQLISEALQDNATQSWVNQQGFLTEHQDLSGYLPLSGGTMTGPITLTSGGSSAYKKTALSFTNADGSREDARIGTSTSGPLGIYSRGTIYLKPDNQMNAATTTGIMLSATTFTYNDYKVWHEGNDGADSGLDADLLDGVQGSDYLRKAYRNNSKHQIDIMDLDAIAGSASNWTNAANTDLKLVANNNAMVFTVSYTMNQRKAFIQVGHSALSYGNALGDLYLNKFGGNVYIGEILAATINSNVASATKLQTARSIWGQSFDGTGDITGTLTISGGNAGAMTQGAGSLHVGSPTEGHIMIDQNDIQAKADGTTPTTLYINDWGGNVVFCSTSGNVGVGTRSTSAKLDVYGAIRSRAYDAISSNNAAFIWDKPGSNYTGMGSSGIADTIYFGACTEAGAWVTTYSQIWKFGGDILTTGGITQYSDIRKKTKLNDVELTLKQVANAPLIEHYYNNDDKKTTHVGSIAQYWAELNDWFCKLDSDGFYTMEIQNAALASVISVARELERYESKTDKKIRMLKKRINELENEIEKLKSA